MEVWLQKHDHTTESLSDRSREDCLALLDSFDWDSELANYEAALEKGADRCPPGMGFVDGGRTLHVMPIHDGVSHYLYSCDHPVRLLAFFGAGKSLNAWAVPDAHRHELLALHYAGKQDELVRTLAKLNSKPASS
jgi:hypothetical protein